MLYLQEANGSSHSGSMEGVVEQLARFRSQVRAFALARHESATKPGLYPERIPLLTACDTLRNDLAPLGVILKVFGLCKQWSRVRFECHTLPLIYLFMSLPYFRTEEPPQPGKSLVDHRTKEFRIKIKRVPPKTD